MSLIIATSTAADGSMKSTDKHFASVLSTRARFLKKYTIDPAATTLVQVTYGGDDYCRFYSLSERDKGDGITRDATIEADALVTTNLNHALLLPLADCIGAVIHDPTTNVLMVSHLGRHNLEQFSGTKCVQYLSDNHNVNISGLKIWLSPAAGKDAYPLHSFNNRGLHEVAIEQIIAAGVPSQNIEVSAVDSAADEAYFSHSQFLKGQRQTDGRYAIIAMMY